MPVSAPSGNPQNRYAGVVLLEDLLNTLDVDAGKDALADPGAAAAWLAEQGHPGDVEAADLQLARGVRAALRGELGEAGAPLPPGAALVVLGDEGAGLAGNRSPPRQGVGEGAAEAGALAAAGGG